MGKLTPLTKYIAVVITLFLLHFCGLFLQLLELDYERFFHHPLNSKSIWFANQELSKDIPESAPVYEFNYTFIHSPAKKCSNVKSTPSLLLLVKSAVANFDRRDVIRRTWGLENRFLRIAIKRVFVLGIGPPDVMHIIKKESAQHNDIVQSNFYDSYYNNTIKTVMAMQWAEKYCINNDYFIFIDDDYYISVKNIVRFLKQTTASYSSLFSENEGNHKKINVNNHLIEETTKPFDEKLFAGYVIQSAPLRHSFSKWFVPLEEYPFSKWPPYVTGGSFILSSGALHDMLRASERLRKFRFDDIFLGIMALNAGLNLTHCENFYFTKATFADAESYLNVITSHGYSDPLQLEFVWNEVRTAGYA